MKLRPVKITIGEKLGMKGNMLEIYLNELVTHHFAFLGLSGSGKSRALTDFILQAHGQGCGVTVVDPGKNLTEDVLAHKARGIIRTKNKSVLDKIHVFEPGNYGTSFRLDLFRFNPIKPVHPEMKDNAYRAWLHNTVQKIGEIVQLKQGQVDFEQNARLQRVLTNLLTAVGMAVDKDGRHLPLSDALFLLSVDEDDDRPRQILERVAPFLDRDTLSDLRRIHEYRRVEDRMREIESTFNRFRSIMPPLAQAIFSATAGDDVLDVRKIILDGGLMLWDLWPTEYFSPDQKSLFGKLAIHLTLSALMSLPRELRRQHVLVVDEAAEFANEQLLWALGAMRKTGLYIVLAAQDLSSFRKKEFDMSSKVVSQCNLVCFNQVLPDDLDILARIVYAGTYNFTPLEQDVERDGGWEWIDVEETSESYSEQGNWSEGETETHTKSKTRTDSHQLGTGTSDGETQSEQATRGTSGTRSKLEHNHSDPAQVSEGTSGSASRGKGTSRTKSATESHGTTNGESEGRSKGRTASKGGSVGKSFSKSQKKIPLHKVKTVKQKTGSLEEAFNDQVEERKDRIATQGRQHAVVKIQGTKEAHEIRTRDVPDPFSSEKAQAAMVDWMKREAFDRHPYTFTPNLDPAERERRVETYLGEQAEQDVDEPLVIDNQENPFDD